MATLNDSQELEIKEEPDAKVRKINGIPTPKCDSHEKDCSYWRDECDCAICLQCVDTSHQKHKLKLL